MKKHFKTVFAVALLAAFCRPAAAQVENVSFTLSPVAEYTWWDKDMTIDNNIFWGGKVGFGFGPLLELRGYYLKSANIKGSSRPLRWDNLQSWAENMQKSEFDVYRYGGELKLNLWKAKIFTPYITAGAGVQNISFVGSTGGETPKDVKVDQDQLYASLGVGLKFNISRRSVLSLEGRRMLFNTSNDRLFMDPKFTDEDGKVLGTWGAQLGLDFYLGGYDASEDGKIGDAYRRIFDDGFKGIKLTIEPAMTYINFTKEQPYADNYFLGGSVGLDLSALVGLRGFYYQACKEPNKLSLDFNRDMSIYGGNIVTRLSNPLGVTPYLQLGGGYMHVGKNYNAKPWMDRAKSTAFAFGGAGLEVPVSKWFALFGTVNALFTPAADVKATDVKTTAHINTNMMYTAGLRFNIGYGANPANEVDKRVDRRVERSLDEQRKASNREINELRKEYERQNREYEDRLAQFEDSISDLKVAYGRRIAQLNSQLNYALDNNDSVKIVNLYKEKKQTERKLNEVERNERATRHAYEQQLTRARKENAEDVEDIVRRVVSEQQGAYEGGRYDGQYRYNGQNVNVPLVAPQYVPIIVPQYVPMQQPQGYYMQPQTVQPQAVQPQVVQPAPQQYGYNQPPVIVMQDDANAGTRSMEPATRTVVKNEEDNADIAAIRKELQELRRRADAGDSSVSAPVQYQPAPSTTQPVIIPSPQQPQVMTVRTNNDAYLNFRSLGVFTGIGFGDMTAWNLGVRGYWQMGRSNFDFVPEVYFGVGNRTGLGLSANAIYKFNLKRTQDFVPYAGLGLGLNHGNKTRFGSNIILGVMMKLRGSHLFADYTARSMFKQNQFSVGYAFYF